MTTYLIDADIAFKAATATEQPWIGVMDYGRYMAMPVMLKRTARITLQNYRIS